MNAPLELSILADRALTLVQSLSYSYVQEEVLNERSAIFRALMKLPPEIRGTPLCLAADTILQAINFTVGSTVEERIAAWNGVLVIASNVIRIEQRLFRETENIRPEGTA